jgi:flavin-dependent dehydrogenase
VPAHYDVIVIGSGIAGAFLARQLKLTRPGRTVLVLEAAETIEDFKVGESTVEVSSNYMVRRLGLSTYLYQHQLLKNGLRFFFDSPEKDLPITEMTEIGSDHFPFHPSFQLERASLERDLVPMNRALGIEVQLGAKVVDLTVAPPGPHTVVWERGGERHEATSRWVCDASGRRQVLQRKLGHKVTKEDRLNTGAAWGRYRNVGGLDAVNDPAWKARVRYTTRHLSTNHFMYEGYWIWFIPLAQDLMSVGVVYDKDRCPDGPRSREEMEAFLQRHRAPRDLMKGAVFEDFRTYAHLPFHSDTYFSTNRWAVTGEAGAFTDPFYSPGSDFIATANDLITGIINADADASEGATSPAAAATAQNETSRETSRFTELTELANAFYRLKYESSIALYANQYPIFGSYEIYRLKYMLDFHNYYNLVYWPFLADKLTDTAWLKEEIGFAEYVVRCVKAFGEHFTRMGEELRARGEYHASNRGIFLDALDIVGKLNRKLGPTLDPAFRKEQLDRVHSEVFAAMVERMQHVPGLASRERVVAELSLPIAIALKQIDETCLTRLLQRVAGRLTRDVRDQFPDDGVEQVTLEATPAGAGAREVLVGVLGPREERRAAIVERARALWDERTPAPPM